ncbi:MAG: YdcF family protein [Eubacterium sp.]|nr:YdcF family protein [Eubacterium sp.]
MILVFYAILTLFAWGVFLFSFIRDRSRYRNCYLLFIALIVTVFSATFLAGKDQVEALVVVFFVIMIALLAVPIGLVSNGVIMIKKEGFSIANVLSLALGLFVGFGEIAAFLTFLLPIVNYGGYNKAMVDLTFVSILIAGTVIYISQAFLAFMFYTLFLMIIPRKRDFDYVIIHGAGLKDGKQVTRLLADRLDKAIAVYRKDPTPPVMIPSGGKGSDERTSEADAMAAYLIEKGIPEDMIIKEDESATTLENLKNSKAIIESRPGPHYTALVTSNYHVYRALRYCRKIGLKCTGIGSRVALYYWPSALIREFIAIHAEKKHLIYLMSGWVIFMLPTLALYFTVFA